MDSILNQAIYRSRHQKFAINIGLINFKGDMVELKMNIPYKFENTQEALEKLCKLISNFTKKAGINPERY